MFYKPKLSPQVRLVVDVVALCALALVVYLLGRRTPADDLWNYTSGILFLFGILLTVGGVALVVIAAKMLTHDPQNAKHSPLFSIGSAIGLVVWWLIVMFVGVCAVLTLYMRWTTNLLTGFLHVAVPFDRYVDQLYAERSGLAALTVVLIAAIAALNYPSDGQGGERPMKPRQEAETEHNHGIGILDPADHH